MNYANPFNACDRCGHRITSGGTNKYGLWQNTPCGCHAGFQSVCRSWSPVNGCQCLANLGERTHGDPTFSAEAVL